MKYGNPSRDMKNFMKYQTMVELEVLIDGVHIEEVNS